jgi:hypothetical protein
VTASDAEFEKTFGPRLLAYADILGWSDLVGSPRRREVLSRIDEAIRHLQTAQQMRRKELAEADIPLGTTVRATFFSDTFVYSCDAIPTEAVYLMGEVRRLCAYLLARGHYTRGAVVVGDLRHDDDGTVVGRALIEAHEIERHVAKYPRLVVTDEAAPLVLDSPEGTSRARTDFDGLGYVDVFARRDPREIRSARGRAERNLAETYDKAIYPNLVRALNLRAKYAWMVNYLGEKLDEATASK